MKQRNYLLALALLALFAASGVLYFRKFLVPKPFGIILFVGEGLVSSKLTAARLYDGGADRRLNIQSLPHLALLSTHGADFAVPDAASAASALACGMKVNERALSIAPDGRSLPTLLELARQQGRAAGLVTNGSLTDPTPAAFYAHDTDARNHDAAAAQLVDAGLDVVLGGGGADFLPEFKGGRRRDARDLTLELAQHGYHLLRSNTDLQEVQPWRGPMLAGIFDAGDMAFRHQLDAGSPEPSLAEMVRRAIEVLQLKTGGYLLVVDAGLVERASLQDQGERVLQELVEMDRALGVALQYAGKKTLVVVAGGQSTGGMVLNGYPLRQDHGVALLGSNASGLPSITWATGPGGPSLAPSPAVPDASPAPAMPDRQTSNPAVFYAPYSANVADDAIAAGFGPGSERLQGFLDNTFIFELINSQL